MKCDLWSVCNGIGIWKFCLSSHFMMWICKWIRLWVIPQKNDNFVTCLHETLTWFRCIRYMTVWSSKTWVDYIPIHNNKYSSKLAGQIDQQKCPQPDLSLSFWLDFNFAEKSGPVKVIATSVYLLFHNLDSSNFIIIILLFKPMIFLLSDLGEQLCLLKSCHFCYVSFMLIFCEVGGQ